MNFKTFIETDSNTEYKTYFDYGFYMSFESFWYISNQHVKLYLCLDGLIM